MVDSQTLSNKTTKKYNNPITNNTSISVTSYYVITILIKYDRNQTNNNARTTYNYYV